ncbi:hypothetical protein NUW58_g9758 [Xylaria curta]|uniref:Uncharacterized protein n=1 Tax=Xylaria curta TaxID=42375 RepID=A0ACC1MVL7_9PEZI|nr:hypothetical protein NUW58_g9758 [Xylaria curta]
MKASFLLSTALVGLASAIPMTFDISEEMIAKLRSGTSSGMLEIAATGWARTPSRHKASTIPPTCWTTCAPGAATPMMPPSSAPSSPRLPRIALARKLVLSGYSQGAALVHAATKQLPAAVLNKVAAAVTYGDTRKKQDGGVVPNITPSRSLILCHDGDRVCDGTLIITDAHHDYQDLAPTAVNFIVSKV